MNKISLSALLLIGLSGCGDSPRSNSVMCFLKEGFVNCHDKEVNEMFPEPINGIDGEYCLTDGSKCLFKVENSKVVNYEASSSLCSL
jgi:hypothetical protein